MDLISEEVVMKLTKEMYLEIANTEYDVQTISDCTSYVASKCREYIDERIRKKNIPSAFEGMTNREVLKALFPIDENSGARFTKVYLDHESIESFELLTTQKWLDSPYKGVSK